MDGAVGVEEVENVEDEEEAEEADEADEADEDEDEAVGVLRQKSNVTGDAILLFELSCSELLLEPAESLELTDPCPECLLPECLVRVDRTLRTLSILRLKLVSLVWGSIIDGVDVDDEALECRPVLDMDSGDTERDPLGINRVSSLFSFLLLPWPWPWPPPPPPPLPLLLI